VDLQEVNGGFLIRGAYLDLPLTAPYLDALLRMPCFIGLPVLRVLCGFYSVTDTFLRRGMIVFPNTTFTQDRGGEEEFEEKIVMWLQFQFPCDSRHRGLVSRRWVSNFEVLLIDSLSGTLTKIARICVSCASESGQ